MIEHTLKTKCEAGIPTPYSPATYRLSHLKNFIELIIV